MKVYVQSIDYLAWLVIQNRPRPIPNNNDGRKLEKGTFILDYTKEQLENIHGDANKVKKIKSKSTLEESESGEDRKDLVMIPRTKKKSRKKKHRKSQSIQNHQKNCKNEVQQEENVCCYECIKPGYIKLKYPNFKKKNHIISTWSDENEFEEENNHKRTENLCFMAMGEINKENIEMVLNDLEKVLKEYNKLEKEKKNWEIQLEEYNKLIHENKGWEIQLEEYNKLRNEKKDWDIQLKEYQLENNLLQEENFELHK
ncbi:protein CROWDED NUCLEI 3-like [Nicotiana tomentosiformis]|uniref:protein CROWDED NUCLEI 3-like n=1 Tax=Nicotiana tomentosiformis TaxID=4098 RepID=UPI00388CB551